MSAKKDPRLKHFNSFPVTEAVKDSASNLTHRETFSFFSSKSTLTKTVKGCRKNAMTPDDVQEVRRLFKRQ